MKYSFKLIQGMSVIAVVLHLAPQAYAGDLFHKRKPIADQKIGKDGKLPPPPVSSEYVFTPEALSEIQFQANIEVNKNMGFDPTEKAMERLKKPKHAAEFLEFLKGRLEAKPFNELFSRAIEIYSKNHDAVLWETSPGVYAGTEISGKGSFEVYANNLILEHRMEEVIRITHEKLKAAYPGKIMEDIKWPFNNVGGIYARLGIVYCSTNEYLAFFATTTDQAGFSGVYPSMNVADIMFSGLMIGEHKKFYWPMKKGWSYLAKNVDWTYEMKDFAGMMDLGQGNIAANFWQGIIAPAIFGNHDFSSMEDQIANCAKSMLLRAWHKLGRPDASVSTK